ncbi:hypothetical protein [Micromonospora kangleipakensis]|nr:hypothetical protein [Micromonospora kangleipakensis]
MTDDRRHDQPVRRHPRFSQDGAPNAALDQVMRDAEAEHVVV